MGEAGTTTWQGFTVPFFQKSLGGLEPTLPYTVMLTCHTLINKDRDIASQPDNASWIRHETLPLLNKTSESTES